VFATWRDYVHERPKTTTLVCQTAWRALEAFCKSRDVLWPAHVTPALMTAFVDHMRSQGLASKTVNERLRKVRAVYRIAIGKSKLSVNPATKTLGVKLATHHKGRERRKPFSAADLQSIFGSRSPTALPTTTGTAQPGV
jgi:site-specific recombinase XerC